MHFLPVPLSPSASPSCFSCLIVQPWSLTDVPGAPMPPSPSGLFAAIGPDVPHVDGMSPSFSSPPLILMDSNVSPSIHAARSISPSDLPPLSNASASSPPHPLSYPICPLSPPGSRSSSSGVPLSLRPPLRSSRQSPSPPSVTSLSAALHDQSLLPPHASQSCCPPSLTSSAFSPATTSPYGPRHTHSRAPSTSLSHYGPTTGCPRMSISSSSVSSAQLPRLRSSDPPSCHSPPLLSPLQPSSWSSVISSCGYGSNWKALTAFPPPHHQPLLDLPLLAAS